MWVHCVLLLFLCHCTFVCLCITVLLCVTCKLIFLLRIKNETTYLLVGSFVQHIYS